MSKVTLAAVVAFKNEIETATTLGAESSIVQQLFSSFFINFIHLVHMKRDSRDTRFACGSCKVRSDGAEPNHP